MEITRTSEYPKLNVVIIQANDYLRIELENYIPTIFREIVTSLRKKTPALFPEEYSREKFLTLHSLETRKEFKRYFGLSGVQGFMRGWVQKQEVKDIDLVVAGSKLIIPSEYNVYNALRKITGIPYFIACSSSQPEMQEFKRNMAGNVEMVERNDIIGIQDTLRKVIHAILMEKFKLPHETAS